MMTIVQVQAARPPLPAGGEEESEPRVGAPGHPAPALLCIASMEHAPTPKAKPQVSHHHPESQSCSLCVSFASCTIAVHLSDSLPP